MQFPLIFLLLPDLSVDPAAAGKVQFVKGTVKQLLESSQAGPQGKALRSVPIATNAIGHIGTPFASCQAAWTNTSGTVFANNIRMPLNDIAVGTAATCGAVESWILQPDGFGVSVDIQSGSTIFAVASDTRAKFARIGEFCSSLTHNGLKPTFGVEAILATTNTRM